MPGATARRRGSSCTSRTPPRGSCAATERYDGRTPVNLGAGARSPSSELVELIARADRLPGRIAWDARSRTGSRGAASTSRARRERSASGRGRTSGTASPGRSPGAARTAVGRPEDGWWSLPRLDAPRADRDDAGASVPARPSDPAHGGKPVDLLADPDRVAEIYANARAGLIQEFTESRTPTSRPSTPTLCSTPATRRRTSPGRSYEGVGFDPSYADDRDRLPPNVAIRSELYSREAGIPPAELRCVRRVPMNLVPSITGATSAGHGSPAIGAGHNASDKETGLHSQELELVTAAANLRAVPRQGCDRRRGRARRVRRGVPRHGLPARIGQRFPVRYLPCRLAQARLHPDTKTSRAGSVETARDASHPPTPQPPARRPPSCSSTVAARSTGCSAACSASNGPAPPGRCAVANHLGIPLDEPSDRNGAAAVGAQHRSATSGDLQTPTFRKPGPGSPTADSLELALRRRLLAPGSLGLSPGCHDRVDRPLIGRSGPAGPPGELALSVRPGGERPPTEAGHSLTLREAASIMARR